jgi:hypothetical protein
MITKVTFGMNGEVRCIGRIPPAVTGGRILDEANSTTVLVVYCKLISMCITTILSISRNTLDENMDFMHVGNV